MPALANTSTIPEATVPDPTTPTLRTSRVVTDSSGDSSAASTTTGEPGAS